MTEESVQAIVIGAGVVGCAVAQKLASRGFAPLILEAGPRIAEGVTSRNSGVIHAGIYYPPNSLKTTTCLRGKHLLKEWCSKKNVHWRETGKWIVGQAGEEESLHEIHMNALSSGATGLTWKTKPEINRELPQIRGEYALYSHETGIVDAHGFAASLLNDAEDHGALLLTNAEVRSIEPRAGGGFTIESSRGRIATELVFNAAGLYADDIARMAGAGSYRIYPWRGDYFKLARTFGLKSLVYPVRSKNSPGLGVHLTIDLAGACKLGPDVEIAFEKNEFLPREDKLSRFFEQARNFLPQLEPGDLRYDMCGLRPKVRAPGDKQESDFIVQEDLPGFVNLIGIESPGLTAAMALGERACSLVN